MNYPKVDEDNLNLIIGYSLICNERGKDAPTYYFWEFIEEYCGVIGEDNRFDLEFKKLLLLFYDKDLVSIMMNCWLKGQSYRQIDNINNSN